MSSVTSTLREELARHFDGVVGVETEGEFFRVTLPGTTFDGHLVNVYLRRLTGGFWEVQDASTAAADLFAHGLHIKARQREKMRRIAQQLAVTLDGNDGFKVICREEELAFYVWRVRDAAALASSLLLEHRLAKERTGLRRQIRETIHALTQRGLQVKERATARGKLADHRVDFEIRWSAPSLAAAVQVLSPAGGPWLRAEAYAFMVGDLDGQYRHIAVLEEPGQWSSKALQLVRRVAARVVEAELPEPAAADLRQVIGELLAA
jgi:hypothetical protein